jgi:hypothetical protein
MTTVQIFSARTGRALRSRRHCGGERGDIPGWVMITLMTAALVAVIWGVAEGQLQDLFRDAMNRARR